MQEVKKKSDENDVVSFPRSGQLNFLEVVRVTRIHSAFLCSGFHAYLCFLKINAPDKSYS